MMDDIIDTLKRKENPLVVLDEADKLSDQVLYFFISLYNQLEGHCGIILCATNFLDKRIKKGLRTKRHLCGKRCYSYERHQPHSGGLRM